MSNRKLAEKLARDEPNITWEALIAKKRSRGLSDDATLEDIIASSQRSRASVNKKLGL